jgi:hypothetical protein
MAKFIALYGLMSLSVSRIERDKEGKIVLDQTVSFNRGLRTSKGIQPAYFSTTEKGLLAHLRADMSNEANGGASFQEVQAIEPTSPKATKAPKVEPVAEPVTEPVTVTDSDTKTLEGASYPEVTNLQEAGSILKTMFPELKARDISPKANLLKVAEANGISFPNL